MENNRKAYPGASFDSFVDQNLALPEVVGQIWTRGQLSNCLSEVVSALIIPILIHELQN